MSFLAYLPHWRHARIITRCREEAERIGRELGQPWAVPPSHPKRVSQDPDTSPEKSDA